MTRDEWRQKIEELDVFDTHTHLIGGSLAASDFWNIGNYFWLMEELKSAGYPKNAEKLPEDKRREAYAKAFQATRNTSMNWVVRQIFKRLYNLEITDANSILEADEAVKTTWRKKGWAKEVTDKLSIRKIVVNGEDSPDFPELPGVCVQVPRIDSRLFDWIRSILSAEDGQKAAAQVSQEIENLLSKFRSQGRKGIMTTLPRFHGNTWEEPEKPARTGNTFDSATNFVLNKICSAAQKQGLFVQFFLGMEHGWSNVTAPVDDTERVLRLHGLFVKYPVPFEIVLASQGNNLDAVQACRLFSNVSAGGLWWYNFRASTYRECMQQRFEAIPASRSSFIASDARCIEWCYGKILLVKTLMADFLYDQIQKGWTDEEYALGIAKEWLYGSAAARYL